MWKPWSKSGCLRHPRGDGKYFLGHDDGDGDMDGWLIWWTKSDEKYLRCASCASSWESASSLRGNSRSWGTRCFEILPSMPPSSPQSPTGSPGSFQGLLKDAQICHLEKENELLRQQKESLMAALRWNIPPSNEGIIKSKKLDMSLIEVQKGDISSWWVFKFNQ